MESPRPVPPNRRLMEVSACVNGWKSFSIVEGSIPMPVSWTSNSRFARSVLGARARNPHVDLAALGELDRVGHEIEQDLFQASAVAEHRGRKAGVNEDRQVQALVLGLRGEQLGGPLDGIAQNEFVAVEFELASLDPRQVENVVDDGEQRLRRIVDGSEQLLLPLVEPRPHEEIRHAEDAVHRRADLVAHVGEELRLGERRGLRVLRRLLEGGQRRLMLGDNVLIGDVCRLQARYRLFEIVGEIGVGEAQKERVADRRGVLAGSDGHGADECQAHQRHGEVHRCALECQAKHIGRGRKHEIDAVGLLVAGHG